MKSPPALRHLRVLYDPVALCYGLKRILLDQGQSCDHTFRHTRAIFAQYAPDVDVDAYIALLQEMGAQCDCEVGNNICGVYVKGA
jgi:hypothetical protein